VKLRRKSGMVRRSCLLWVTSRHFIDMWCRLATGEILQPAVVGFSSPFVCSEVWAVLFEYKLHEKK